MTCEKTSVEAATFGEARILLVAAIVTDNGPTVVKDTRAPEWHENGASELANAKGLVAIEEDAGPTKRSELKIVECARAGVVTETAEAGFVDNNTAAKMSQIELDTGTGDAKTFGFGSSIALDFFETRNLETVAALRANRAGCAPADVLRVVESVAK